MQKDDKYSKYSSRYKKDRKLGFLIYLIGFLLLGIILRLLYFNIFSAEKYRQEARSNVEYVTKLDPKRGQILDRNGFILAASGQAFKLDADLVKMRDQINRRLKDPKDTKYNNAEEYLREAAKNIASLTGKTEETIYGLLTAKDSKGNPLSTVTLGNRLEISNLDKLKKVADDNYYRWLIFYNDTKRYYPNNRLMSHVLGFTGLQDTGQFGLEFYYDNLLKGIGGVKISETNPQKKDLAIKEPLITLPIDGADIILTLDEKIQLISEDVAKKAMEKYQANNITVIISNPKTGEILALVNSPDYDLNNPQKLTRKDTTVYDLWRNNAIEVPFEPGSTFKILTMAAALNEGVVSESDTFNCPGYIDVDGERIWCSNRMGHGKQTLTDIMRNSCNPGFIEVASKLGKIKLYEYMEKFGVTSTTGVDLPGESNSIIRRLDLVNNFDLATISIGQTNKLTPIQSLMNLNVILNKGKKTTPHVVSKAIRTELDGTKKVLYEFKEKETEDILKDEVCDILVKQLTETVDSGGSSNAKIDGISVLGKTGTAEKINPKTGKYEFYISSFLGAAPATDPLISVYVSVDTPQGDEFYGNKVAAPMAKEIIELTLKYLDTVK